MADTPDDDADRSTETASATKAPAKKAPAKKATAKKAPAKRTSAPRAASARSQESGSQESGTQDNSQDSSEGQGRSGSDGSSTSRTNSADLAVAAAQQLVTLTGKTFEGIVGLSRSDDGWDVEVEVVEMRRIPSTTDVIAVYRVSVDQGGDLLSYRRVHRYLRGQASEQR
jgi:hypothetical protein